LNLVLPHGIDEHVLLAVAVKPKWDNAGDHSVAAKNL
jgi:hypothetical protein